MKNYNYGKLNQHTWYIGVEKKFQWFTFSISTDNACFNNNYFLFEFRILWLRIWYTYDFKSRIKQN